MLHTSAAERRGLKTGDLVCVESRYGKYVGRLRVTELVHPDCVNCSGSFGHWAKGLPISREEGCHAQRAAAQADPGPRSIR